MLPREIHEDSTSSISASEAVADLHMTAAADRSPYRQELNGR
jgi:hypothetical protein